MSLRASVLCRSNRKEYEIRHNLLLQSYEQYGSTADGTAPIECLEGESAGDYNTEWTHTFDLVFLILMGVLLAALCVWTELTHPELFTNGWFWLEQLPKVALMMAVSLLGGLLCRYFCRIDADGYIVTSKSDVFKVNYTRKLQHFAAYLIPLLMHTHAAKDIEGPLTLTWGNWVTLLGFLVLIKPIREASTFFMLQFNSLDRPEDRPNTLSWSVECAHCALILVAFCSNDRCAHCPTFACFFSFLFSFRSLCLQDRGRQHSPRLRDDHLLQMAFRHVWTARHGVHCE